MSGKGVFCIMFLMALNHVNAKDGVCVMQGPCAEGEYGNELLCTTSGPAAALPLEEEEAHETLQELCPHLVTDGFNSPVCCSPKQLQAYKSNSALTKVLFGRCPACYENFRKIFCEFTCSPNQDNFLVATKTVKLPEQTERDVINEVSYHISKSFVEKIYDSCKDVVGLTPGSTALAGLMCGIWSNDCSAERWLQFMGLSVDNGGASPFQINFKLVADEESVQGIIPVTGSLYRCSEPAGPSNTPCSCMDCKEACSKK